MNILLNVCYDGSNYFGWQRQKNFITVQQRLEEAISSLFNKSVEVRGASRTDTGVHALAQKALFHEDTKIPMDKLPYAINTFLPDDIVVTCAEIVDTSFHPQYSVKKKTYKYKILNAKFRNPMLRNYTEFVHTDLDIKKMKLAAKYFIGTYDFKAFCASGATSKTSIRTIYDLYINKNNDIIDIVVTGNGFLYNMVRIIVGTLIYVGQDKIKPYDIQDIILSKDRTRAGKTVSPNGLTLMEVFY